MKKSKTAADIMSKSLVTTTGSVMLTDALELMLRYNISCLPVVDDSYNLIGLMTTYDIINFALSGEAHRTSVSESMTKKIISLASTDDLESIVNTILNNRLHRAPVVEDGKLVGIVSRRDILREMLKIYQYR